MQFKPRGRFPPIDSLMQTWPEELEPYARSIQEATSSINVDVLTLTKTICGILDIPVYDEPLDSLYWLFMLYLEMKNNEYINPPDEHKLVGAHERANFASFA
jgi:Intraflagellar transport complex B protein 46 C terminal